MKISQKKETEEWSNIFQHTGEFNVSSMTYFEFVKDPFILKCVKKSHPQFILGQCDFHG